MEENTMIEIEVTPDDITEVNETVATESKGGSGVGAFIAGMIVCAVGKKIIGGYCKKHRAGREDRMAKYLKKKGYKVEAPEKEVIVIDQEPDEEETPEEPVKKDKNK